MADQLGHSWAEDKMAREVEGLLAQAPSYRKTAIWWVVSAKREETKQRRLLALIELSAAGRRLDPMAPGKR